jgi:hypothetical protein
LIDIIADFPRAPSWMPDMQISESSPRMFDDMAYDLLREIVRFARCESRLAAAAVAKKQRYAKSSTQTTRIAPRK